MYVDRIKYEKPRGLRLFLVIVVLTVSGALPLQMLDSAKEEDAQENKAPVVELIYPKGGEVWWTKGSTTRYFDIIWKAYDPNGDSLTFDLLLFFDLKVINLTEDETLISNNTYKWVWEVYGCVERVGPITVVAKDNNSTNPLEGKDSTDGYVFVYIHPTIELLEPNGGEVWSGTRIIRWRSEPECLLSVSIEVIRQVSSVEWHICWRDSCGYGINEYEWDTTAVSDGQYIVKVTGYYTHAADEDYSDSLFTINNSAYKQPRILSYYPERVLWVSEGKCQIFYVEVYDPNDDPLQYQWFLNGKLIEGENASTYTFTADYNSSGFHIITVKISDSEYTVSCSWNVTVVNVNRPPRIISIEPAKNLTIREGEEVAFVINATDPDNDFLTYEWYLDGSKIGGNTSSFIYHTDYHSAGIYYIYVRVSDRASEVEHSWKITVIDVYLPPWVNITYPTEGDIVEGIVIIRGTSSDVDGSVEFVEINIDNRAWRTVAGTLNWSYTWGTTLFFNGVHTIYAKAFDGLNYSHVDTVTVIVNNPDFDGDRIPDNIDLDDDNDGWNDTIEKITRTNPFDNSSVPWNSDNDRIPNFLDLDDDNDGVPDEQDDYPLDATRWKAPEKKEPSVVCLGVGIGIAIVLVVLAVAIFLARRRSYEKKP